MCFNKTKSSKEGNLIVVLLLDVAFAELILFLRIVDFVVRDTKAVK